MPRTDIDIEVMQNRLERTRSRLRKSDRHRRDLVIIGLMLLRQQRSREVKCE